MSISENIAAIRQQIALAAERSGRTAAGITRETPASTPWAKIACRR